MDAEKTKLLIAEDDTFTRTSLTAYLQAEGFALQRATTGTETLELIRADTPDLVITDLNMPEMEGLELLEILSVESPDLPVIILSAEGCMTSVIEALRLGAQDYLQKPIQDMGLLRYSIGRALSYVSLKKENTLYRHSLEELVEKRTARLLHKSTKAQSLEAHKLESVGQLLSGLVHEINTPIQFVSSNIEFLDQSFKSVTVLLEAFERIQRKVKSHELSPHCTSEVERLVEELDLEHLVDGIRVALKQSSDGMQLISKLATTLKERSTY